MKIPKQFKLNNHIIKVKFKDTLNSKFGYYSSAECAIYLAKNILTEEEVLVPLTEVQIQNTFYHELIHVFQHMCGMEYDEVQAQTFGNFLYDYEQNNIVE